MFVILSQKWHILFVNKSEYFFFNGYLTIAISRIEKKNVSYSEFGSLNFPYDSRSHGKMSGSMITRTVFEWLRWKGERKVDSKAKRVLITFFQNPYPVHAYVTWLWQQHLLLNDDHIFFFHFFFPTSYQ